MKRPRVAFLLVLALCAVSLYSLARFLALPTDLFKWIVIACVIWIVYSLSLAAEA